MILHRSPTEVAATLSLPEARLILWRDEVRSTRHLLSATQSRALAVQSSLSHATQAALARYEAELRAYLTADSRPAAERLTRRTVRSVFGALGLAPQSS